MTRRLRTAVLVVHGMGSQRPLDTVRGVINAVWFDDDDHTKGSKKLWSHPEPSGVDLDLTVMTTNGISGPSDRVADFHELYWAHLMSETKAVAVLLWLFELARRGPWLKPSLGALYGATLIFLSLLLLSVSLLAIQFAIWFVRQVPSVDNDPDFLVGDSHSIVFVFLLVICIVAGLTAGAAFLKHAWRLAFGALAIAAIAAVIFWLGHFYESVPLVSGNSDQSTTEALTNLLLPTLVAVFASYALMGRWGLLGLFSALFLSGCAFVLALIFFDVSFADAYASGWIPWSITSFWSSLAAWFFIAIYLAMYAAFLQPYLGDAARYFRNSPANVAVRREIRKQAVATIDGLHGSGDYDRIIVAAHSLGTVVAYDMLRAYYSRARRNFPPPSDLGADFATLDAGKLTRPDARQYGRAAIKQMVTAAQDAKQRFADNAPRPGDEDMRPWLVTDFVTMGSPLTHALYLMCTGNTEVELQEDFSRRTHEREFPTCPPLELDGDRLMTFENKNDNKRYFHHGGLFALTRWTNLYFPVSELLWGDAIGGPVADLFGDPAKTQSDARVGQYVADVPVFAKAKKRDSFFAHILYWSTKQPGGRQAPHIVALRAAIDLPDNGAANALPE